MSTIKEETKKKANNQSVKIGFEKSFWDRNSIINVISLLCSLYGFITGSWFFGLIWPLTLIIDDIFIFGFGRDGIFDTEIGIQRGYQFGHFMLDFISGDGRDLGFNLYDGNTKKTYDKSQMDKWDHMIEQLKLKPGDSLCDIGCGYGDWLNYAKSKGINVVGVNITPEQAAYAQRQYGLDVKCTNWKDILTNKDLKNELFNRFDCITFMDTVEHYVSGKHRANYEKQKEIYTSMFYLAFKMLKENSKSGRVFISCLHQNDRVKRKWPKMVLLYSYFLTRYHSGFYPWGSDGLTKYCGKWFNVLSQVDKTEDYRITAVLDSKQFQAPKIKFTFTKIINSLLLFIQDPHHLHKWVDIYTDSWMSLYGKDPYSTEYNTELRAKTSYVTLWWITFQLKSIKQE